MNKITISSITSIIPAVMLGIGLGILFVLPIVSRSVSDDNPYRDTEIEKTIDSLMEQGGTLPSLSFALIILGSIGLGVHSLLKKYYLATSYKHMNR